MMSKSNGFGTGTSRYIVHAADEALRPQARADYAETVFAEITDELKKWHEREGFSANLMQADILLEEIEKSKKGRLGAADEKTYAKIISAATCLVECAIIIRERDSETQ